VTEKRKGQLSLPKSLTHHEDRQGRGSFLRLGGEGKERWSNENKKRLIVNEKALSPVNCFLEGTGGEGRGLRTRKKGGTHKRWGSALTRRDLKHIPYLRSRGENVADAHRRGKKKEKR